MRGRPPAGRKTVWSFTFHKSLRASPRICHRGFVTCTHRCGLGSFSNDWLLGKIFFCLKCFIRCYWYNCLQHQRASTRKTHSLSPHSDQSTALLASVRAAGWLLRAFMSSVYSCLQNTWRTGRSIFYKRITQIRNRRYKRTGQAVYRHLWSCSAMWRLACDGPALWRARKTWKRHAFLFLHYYCHE